jgi:2OG-Fe(II) oxygenase superfamily
LESFTILTRFYYFFLCLINAGSAVDRVYFRYIAMQVTFAKDNLFYVPNLLSSELCKSIIAMYEKNPEKHEGYVLDDYSEKKLMAEVKSSTDLVIAPDGVSGEMFKEIDLAVNQALEKIVAEMPALQLWPLWWTGYKIQHYKKNEGYFKWHCDAIGPGVWERQLAMVIYLNSVQEGGETSFLKQDLQLKPIQGDAVFFPPFWTHPHCGEVPKSEDKYIISSFISFSIPVASS